MNFIMSLSTTLNSRCINLDVTDLNPEEIAAGLRLDPDYTEDVLNSVIKEKKVN